MYLIFCHVLIKDCYIENIVKSCSTSSGKMRNALLAENKFARYFFYALGEIVLVVIGILIVLQINSRNVLLNIISKS